MTQKLKLIYLVNARMPNERANGVQIAHTCEGMALQGVDLTLVTRYSRDPVAVPEFFGLKHTFLHKKIPVLDIPSIPFRYALRNVSFVFFASLYLFYLWSVSLFSQTKIVVYVRGETILALIPLTYLLPIFFETHQIRNYEIWYKLALRRARGIVVITERLKEKFVREYKIPERKIVVARDAVDADMFESALPKRHIWEKHGIPAHKKIVLYSGTLATEKGVDTLALAGKSVASDIQIVFLGGTPDQVATFTEKYGGESNISILGRVSYTAVPQYLASADALVLPDSAKYSYSNLYTSPMKLFEYMASGRPIVASRVPSLCEVLHEKSALFFEPDNPESLAKAIAGVLEGDGEVMSRITVAREEVSQFTWEKRTKTIIDHILGHIQ